MTNWGWNELRSVAFFFGLFAFGWFAYAAFLGLAASLMRNQAQIVVPFCFTSVLIIIPIIIFLCDQEYFREPSAINFCFSLAAFFGFLFSLRAYKALNAHHRREGLFVCRSAFYVCLCFSLGGPQGFFLPVLFVPEGQLLTMRLIFVMAFTAAAISSAIFFRLHAADTSNN